MQTHQTQHGQYMQTQQTQHGQYLQLERLECQTHPCPVHISNATALTCLFVIIGVNVKIDSQGNGPIYLRKLLKQLNTAITQEAFCHLIFQKIEHKIWAKLF